MVLNVSFQGGLPQHQMPVHAVPHDWPHLLLCYQREQHRAPGSVHRYVHGGRPVVVGIEHLYIQHLSQWCCPATLWWQDILVAVVFDWQLKDIGFDFPVSAAYL